MDRFVGFASSHAAAKRRKIAVVCSYTVSLANFRFKLLQAMVDNGYEVVALGPERHAPTIEALATIGVAFMPIPMARAGVNPVEDMKTLAALWVSLRRISPDVVLCYTMKPIIYGLIAARLAGIQERHALVTGLGYIFSQDAKSSRLSLIRAVAIRLYRFALRGHGRVFVYNQADADDILAGRMVDDLTRIVSVPGSGVDFDHFPPVAVPAGDPVFLMIARLLRNKGIVEFVEAARRLRAQHPNARFQILGRLDPGPLAISRQEIDRWAAEGVVDYLGEAADVRPFLAACTVFVLPSYYREGIPRSTLEALATGRAVITADTPGCRETVVQGENGFIVPPRDPVELAAAMKHFIDDPRLARQMGRRSLEIAREGFDVRIVNRLLLEKMELLDAGA
ncbi:glycosyltransferase family 4 protein [Chelativorans salis]|uniref:Glycosyltransferase family 4 protein n=1 Tax=Chelativorans salis TaxID=2978478 RepID=A0ABT2LSW0_9HYPH|nr:glycosyltransferase family 4 protein [Chelativorans sp. EGI FJ00035]MCT7376932.1 glycosyltransferase family 4 protein [Chelativorans sp. EGI FJ00035]